MTEVPSKSSVGIATILMSAVVAMYKELDMTKEEACAHMQSTAPENADPNREEQMLLLFDTLWELN